MRKIIPEKMKYIAYIPQKIVFHTQAPKYLVVGIQIYMACGICQKPPPVSEGTQHGWPLVHATRTLQHNLGYDVFLAVKKVRTA